MSINYSKRIRKEESSSLSLINIVALNDSKVMEGCMYFKIKNQCYHCFIISAMFRTLYNLKRNKRPNDYEEKGIKDPLEPPSVNTPLPITPHAIAETYYTRIRPVEVTRVIIYCSTRAIRGIRYIYARKYMHMHVTTCSIPVVQNTINNKDFSQNKRKMYENRIH